VPTVAVVGMGLMGSSFALALKEARPDVVVVGSDRDQTVVRKALDRNVFRIAVPDLSVVDMADVVVIGAPISAMHEIFASLSGKTTGKVVTDMASTKAEVMEWAAEAGIDLIGGHPMAGKELSGIDAADPTIFKDAPWVLTRPEAQLVELVKAVGAHPVAVSYTHLTLPTICSV